MVDHPPGNASALRISVLGQLQVGCNGVQLKPGGPMEQAVLAVLVGRVGRTVAVSEIVGGVWGFEPPRTAEKTLQSRVIAFAPHALRRGWRRGRAYS